MDRDKSGRFVKGHTSNGGRPKGLAEQCRCAVNNGADLVVFYVEAFRGSMRYQSTDEKGEPKELIQFVKPEQRLEAAQWLADRGWGKAVQQIDANINPVAKVYEGLDIDRV